jgi:hypothetical protein
MRIRMEGASFRFFRYSFIISLAFSVTSNILSSLCGGAASGASLFIVFVSYACPRVLSMSIFFTTFPYLP